MSLTFLFNQDVYAKKTSFGRTPKTYTKKSLNMGFGKPSKVNQLPKTKIINAHTKKTSKGYTHVNPYARSK